MPTTPDLLAPIAPAADPATLLEILRWPLTVAYALLIGLIGLYGLHRYWLVYLFNRHRKPAPRSAERFDVLPRVTVQLPMFNEGAVAERVIDAACRIDYPADRLQVQVLDDSTDASRRVAADRVAHWKARGVDIELRHRTDRTGYKAGALADALSHATGELIAIFDADFIPPRNFLKRTVHQFVDPGVGMVQTRWAHLNRNDSMLTRGQAIFLDGHFVVEHAARHRSNAWINFNGTAGLWRRQAIEDAGGWQHDTLTEDVDLSYRAQLAGWRFLFLPHVTCPAELPPQINAFKSQQHRWTKGSIQTAMKLLPRLFRADLPLHVKVEAFFHLTSPMVYLYITLFALLFYPTIHINLHAVGRGSWLGVLLGLALFMVGTASATVFYLTSQHAQKRSVWKTLAQVPLLMSIGIGIAVYNAFACLEALVGHDTPFVRTPKYGDRKNPAAAPDEDHCIAKLKIKNQKSKIPTLRLKHWVIALELGLGVYVLYCAHLSLSHENTFVGLPFLLMFAGGYLYVGLTSLGVHLRGLFNARGTAPTPPPAPAAA